MITISYIPNVNLNRENRMEPVRVSSVRSEYSPETGLFVSGGNLYVYTYTRVESNMPCKGRIQED